MQSENTRYISGSEGVHSQIQLRAVSTRVIQLFARSARVLTEKSAEKKNQIN